MIEVGINYLFSNVASYFAAAIFSYYLNNRYVFKKSGSQSETNIFIRFCIVRIGAIGVDTGILAILVSVLKLDVFLSKVFLSIIIIIITYIINKTFVFGS